MSLNGASAGKRVLVIDDSDDFRLLVRQLLEPQGYIVDELASADGIVSTIHDSQQEGAAPDLILCDLLMPGHDGLAVCKSLHANPHTRSIPVVMVSAKDFDQDKKAAMEAGAAGYLVKPFKPDVLVNTVSATLSTQISVRIWGCRGSVAAPERALGHYGGNTPCIELVLPGHRHLIFDAGTGIRALGNSIIGESPLRAAILLTHFHWDHTQGFPFFKPLFIPGNEIQVYGPADSNDALVETIENQMGGAFFPISPEAFLASVKYYGLQEQTFEAF